jgi:hypothetical protein
LAELATSRGIVFDYPPIDGVEPDLLLITHFLEPPDAFLEELGAPVEQLAGSELETQPLLAGVDRRVLILAPPRRCGRSSRSPLAGRRGGS